MSEFSIYSPEVVLNNEPINLIPSTFVYKEGFGENIVAPVANGRNTSLVISTDLTTQKGMMTFSLPSTAVNVELVRTLKNQPGVNVIKASDPDSDMTRTLTSATLINDPEIQLQNEGVIELEFEGNQLV